MGADAKLPDRRSIRMAGRDYSQSGGYIVTIVTHQRMEWFGKVIDGEMRLNTGGKIIDSTWQGLGGQYPLAFINRAMNSWFNWVYRL